MKTLSRHFFRILYVLIQQKINNLIKEKNIWDKNSVMWLFIKKHIPEPFKFITPTGNMFAYLTHIHRHMNETMEHKLHRIRHVQ